MTDDPRARQVEDLLQSWGPILNRKAAALDAEADPEAAPPSEWRPTVGRHREARRFPPADGSSLFEKLLAAGDDSEARRAVGEAWEAERRR